MEISKADTPEDEREISLNETSLKRPLDVIDVIGGHGPWQFRQWAVFFVASLCTSTFLFSTLFLPPQTFCTAANSTGTVPLLFEGNVTASLPETRNSVKYNVSFSSEDIGKICNSTNCETKSRGKQASFSSSMLTVDIECWSSQVEIFAKCIFVVASIFSGALVYLSSNWFGRRPAAVSCSVILIASSLATSWADSAPIFLILRFLSSLCIVNMYLISAFSLMEYVHEDFKLLYFLTGHLGWGLAHILLPAVAWLAEDWKSFNIALSIISVFFSFFVWCSPESPLSFPKSSESTRTRKVLKYAAFTNGYSTTGVDLLSHNYHLLQERKHEMGTLASSKAKFVFILYFCVLFLISFTTAFLYFVTKWHSEWFQIAAGRVSFSFLGTTEVASTIILLFLTCFVAIKYMWAIVSALASIQMIIIFSRSSEGSSRSSVILYTCTVFFAAAAWTLVLAKLFCHKVSGSMSKLNLIVTGVATFAGALVASAVILKAENQDLLLILGLPHFVLAVIIVFLPQNFFGDVV